MTKQDAKRKIKTIDGRTVYYRDWVAEVLAAADAANLSDAAREICTGAMLRDGFENHEKPEYFVAKLAELAD